MPHGEEKKSAATAIVIPCFNEGKNLPELLTQLNWCHPNARVILVDDGSTDKSFRIVDKWAEDHSNVTLLRNPVNKGIGHSIRKGMTYAMILGADVVVTMDADLQHPVSEASNMAWLATCYSDVVVGSRYTRSYKRNVSSHIRVLGSIWFRLLIKLLTGKRITDPTSGFRAYSRDAALWVMDHYPNGYPEPESLVTLCRKFRVTEYPVQMKRREQGTSSINWRKSIQYMIGVSLNCICARFRVDS